MGILVAEYPYGPWGRFTHCNTVDHCFYQKVLLLFMGSVCFFGIVWCSTHSITPIGEHLDTRFVTSFVPMLCPDTLPISAELPISFPIFQCLVFHFFFNPRNPIKKDIFKTKKVSL